MSQIDGQFTYQLLKPIEYASKDGDQKKAEYLLLNEPSGPHIKSMRRLTALVNGAFMEMYKSRDKNAPTPVSKDVDEVSEESFEKQAKDNAEALDAAFAMQNDPDKYEAFLEEFEKAILKDYPRKPLCLVQGQYQMRESHWEQISAKDQIAISMEYCAFFGIGYLGDMIKKSKSLPE